jgi:hypothetical protein
MKLGNYTIAIFVLCLATINRSGYSYPLYSTKQAFSCFTCANYQGQNRNLRPDLYNYQNHLTTLIQHE